MRKMKAGMSRRASKRKQNRREVSRSKLQAGKQSLAGERAGVMSRGTASRRISNRSKVSRSKLQAGKQEL